MRTHLAVLAAWLFVPQVVLAEDTLRVAVVTTVWRHNSHADLIAGRLLEGYTLDGRGDFPRLKLAALYVDQRTAGDKSHALAERYHFPVYDKVSQALTLGGDRLAVDGVLLIAEHGDYAETPTGSIQYPKRRLFEEIVAVFERSGRVVPVFCDKHLGDNRTDIEWLYETATRLKIPLMAGSSLPMLWRYPAADVSRDAPLQEIVATSYHRLDAYGFHALEMVQCLAERRHGGETGIARVQCLEGGAVWDAGDSHVFDLTLLDDAVARFKERPLPAGKSIRDAVQRPVLFVLEYRDGLKASVVTLDGFGSEWSAAWRTADGRRDSTLFWTQEQRPFMHFSYQVQGIEQFVRAGQPPWPVERTLLTSGALDALLVARKERRGLETPWLDVKYKSDWNWQAPPPPPPGRPLDGQ